MKRSPTVLLAALAALCLVFAFDAASQVEVRKAPVTWDQVALEDGPQLYAELCSSCHGADADGQGPAAPALAVPAPDLTLLALHNGGVFPAEQVRDTIAGNRTIAAHGQLEMPNWGHAIADVRPDFKLARRQALAEARIDALTAYLDTVQVR